jgi:hypothetical protein
MLTNTSFDCTFCQHVRYNSNEELIGLQRIRNHHNKTGLKVNFAKKTALYYSSYGTNN